jgi:2-polyprenyl-6-methoxyphenol hydroxylase-like FAD-dependent oxidoreductase
MENTTFDIIIIGAGAVGMATALKLNTKYPSKKILVLEKENEVYETEGIEKFRDFQQMKDLVLKMLKVYQCF